MAEIPATAPVTKDELKKVLQSHLSLRALKRPKMRWRPSLGKVRITRVFLRLWSLWNKPRATRWKWDWSRREILFRRNNFTRMVRSVRKPLTRFRNYAAIGKLAFQVTPLENPPGLNLYNKKTEGEQ